MQRSSLTYPVEIVSGLFGESDALARAAGASRLLIVADANFVHRNEGIGLKIGRYVKEKGLALASAPVVFGGGEKVKLDNFASANRVICAAIDAEIGPDDAILAIGGGSMLDVAGYAAAQVGGGTGIIRVPTTPAAMLCAAFATTAALDAHGIKDSVSLPSVPRAVLIDTSFANTVLDGVWSAGIAEAVRLGLAKEPSLLKLAADLAGQFASRDGSALKALVEATLDVRRSKGGTDHGLATAFELEPKSGWKLPHGYAVAIGIVAYLVSAIKSGEPREKDLETCRDVLGRCGALDGFYHSRHILPPELENF